MNGRGEQERHWPKLWWFNGRPLCAVAAQAEAAVAAQTAVINSPGRTHGGWTHGRDERQRPDRPKP